MIEENFDNILDNTSGEEVKNLFMKIINKMKNENIELPKLFELYYKMTTHYEGDDVFVSLTPFLTEKSAEKSIDRPEIYSLACKKYWRTHEIKILNPGDNDQKPVLEFKVDDTQHTVTFKIADFSN